MRLISYASVLILALAAGPLRAEERGLAFLFGPNAPESAKIAAKAASLAARRWLRTPEASVELRRAGSAEAQVLTGQEVAQNLEPTFTTLAADAREADPAALLSALDAAIQAQSQRAGVHLLVVILSSPPLSGEAEDTLKHLVETCRSGGVRVVVLDSSERGSEPVHPAWEDLAKKSGGAYIRQAKALMASIELIAPEKNPGETEVAQKPAAKPEEKAEAVEQKTAELKPGITTSGGTRANNTAFAIPVHARFVRTSAQGVGSMGPTQGTEDLGGPAANGSAPIVFSETANSANDSHGPMRGFVVLESPLNALQFNVDDNTATYLAKVRVGLKVRNAKGQVAWQIEKEIDVKGPLKKLDARKTGSIYLMRTVTLPAGQYRLESTVEDLIAGSKGSSDEPLVPAQGARGLMVSDALFVRPYRGAADKLESDMSIAFEGEALSPMLFPILHAAEATDLMVYFVIYPDLRGDQPQISMEITKDDKAVARMQLPFHNQLFDAARDGKSVSTVGGMSHEFPYVANVKGVKLGAGEYEARVSIRQGHSTVLRNVPFKIEGDAPVAKAAQTTLQPRKAEGAAAGVDDSAAAVLPDIDPTALKAGEVAPEAGELKRLWEEAAATVNGYSAHLPNFRCNRETHRLKAFATTPDKMEESDSVKDELTFEDGQERYVTLEVNGTKPDPNFPAKKAVSSNGEFGHMLAAIFSPEVAATYKWAGRAMVGDVLCGVFDIEVTRAKSNFVLYYNRVPAAAAYTGRMYIDEESGLPRKLTINGKDLPKEFMLQSPSFSLEYGMVRIGKQDYLLPLRSVLQLRQGKMLVRNETMFRDYHKFESTSDIQFKN